MLKVKKIFSSVLAVMMLASLTACGSGKVYYTTDENSDSQSLNPDVTIAETSIIMATESPQPVVTTKIVAADHGAHLYIDNTTAKAGEYAEVTLYVEDAEENWNMCGIHITYPNVLTVDMIDEEERTVKYKRGEASDFSSASLCKLWVSNLPDELTSQNLGSFFFTEVFDGNQGLDGAIATFYLKIPDDAESGTVYPIGFYYLDSDLFINAENDLSLQQYAFENWTDGSITVE